MANVFDPDFEEQDREGFTHRRGRVSRDAGAKSLGASVYEIPPGEATFPYHWHSANEEMLIVLRGRPSLRTPDGWRQLEEGEVVAFRTGPEGAHQVQNRSTETVRVLLVSQMITPEVCGYPDSGKVSAATRPPGSPATPEALFGFFRREDEVGYWEGEAAPGQE